MRRYVNIIKQYELHYYYAAVSTTASTLFRNLQSGRAGKCRLIVGGTFLGKKVKAVSQKRET